MEQVTEQNTGGFVAVKKREEMACFDVLLRLAKCLRNAVILTDPVKSTRRANAATVKCWSSSLGKHAFVGYIYVVYINRMKNAVMRQWFWTNVCFYPGCCFRVWNQLLSLIHLVYIVLIQSRTKKQNKKKSTLPDKQVQIVERNSPFDSVLLDIFQFNPSCYTNAVKFSLLVENVCFPRKLSRLHQVAKYAKIIPPEPACQH